MDLVGIEPTTSSMPWKRAPSCATGPREKEQRLCEGCSQLNSRLLAIDSQTRQPLHGIFILIAAHFAKARKLSMLIHACGNPINDTNP